MSYDAINNLDNRTRGKEIAETSQKLLGRHELISQRMDEISIDPMSLVRENDPNDIYSVDSVQRDLAYVERRKAQFAQSDREKLSNGLTFKEVSQLAEIAEYDLIRGINLGGWIPQGRAIKTSEYDDIYNGVDLVIEIGSKESAIGHLGLGVDVSFSLDLQKKFQRIKDDIDAFDGEDHRLGVVKYFKSKAAGMRGELSGLPRVVTAFDLGVLEDLAVKSDDLKGHIGQALMITEIEKQLTAFQEYASDANPACATQLEKPLQMIRAINRLTGSSERLEDSEYSKNRKADEAIEAGLNLFV